MNQNQIYQFTTLAFVFTIMFTFHVILLSSYETSFSVTHHGSENITHETMSQYFSLTWYDNYTTPESYSVWLDGELQHYHVPIENNFVLIFHRDYPPEPFYEAYNITVIVYDDLENRVARRVYTLSDTGNRDKRTLAPVWKFYDFYEEIRNFFLVVIDLAIIVGIIIYYFFKESRRVARAV